MNVEYFIGIVPPKEYLERIEQFQTRWVNHLGVEPHITLKARGGLTSDKKWIDKVQNICQDFKSFDLSLGEPKYFGDNILYLTVRSKDLYELHQKIVKEISPSENLIKQYFELDDFIPHLTLGKGQYVGNISTGLSKNELTQMKDLVDKELAPYPVFEVDFIRIYGLDPDKKRYEKYLDIPLNK